MRHNRFTEIFSKLFGLNKERELGALEELEELSKYVKSRDDKVAYLEKKLKKIEKDLDAERKQAQSYLKEVETATASYIELQAGMAGLKKELDEVHLSFNKVYKEKVADKQIFDAEISKVSLELKTNKELVTNLKASHLELKKALGAKEKLIVSWGNAVGWLEQHIGAERAAERDKRGEEQAGAGERGAAEGGGGEGLQGEDGAGDGGPGDQGAGGRAGGAGGRARFTQRAKTGRKESRAEGEDTTERELAILRVSRTDVGQGDLFGV
jgi:hypothetical protein